MENIISLDDDDRSDARNYSDTVLRKLVGPNYTRLAESNRFYVGRLGEIAVRRWAESKGLMYTETVNNEGVPDEQDFLFPFADGRTARVNVKNSLHPSASYLMQPVVQANKHEQDLYIGASSEDDGNNVIVKLWGAITRRQFMSEAQRVIRKIETLQFPLEKLPYCMEHLARQMMKKHNGS